MVRAKRPVLGWCEQVLLPDLCGVPIDAKIDTGAWTSSLHAFELEIVETNGLTVAHFEIHPHNKSRRDRVEASAEVVRFATVKSSTGERQRRPVIVTPVRIAETTLTIHLNLTNRDEMGFRMLLGRAALRKRFLVDPGRKNLQGAPT